MDRATTGPPATTKTEAGAGGLRAGARVRQGRPNTSSRRSTRTGARAGSSQVPQGSTAGQQDQHSRNRRGNRGLPQDTAIAIAGSRSSPPRPAELHKAPQLQEPAREPGTASAGYSKNRRQEQPT
ncbi:hypothetical protein NDU88_002285 [Pleurodeles waltl]|uniref:Uncharacterized protein n=1 Tax=Pleurodeles waltl TaxID=8319 RepID=A0AAV7W203_PLEWA|nr:hypothetical protein NDU88_002285 [Pleurodeles waltl]